MQFDFVAPYYDFISKLVFGSVIEKTKTSLFSRITHGSKVLFIGGGSGYSLEILLNTKKNLVIDFVDASHKMILQAKNRVKESSDIKFHQIHIEEFSGDSYDFVITEFFFDLFDEKKIVELVKIISSKTNKKGNWIDTDFRESLNFKNKIILKLMYQFFKITIKIASNKLVYTKPIFKKAGFQIIAEKKSHTSFISSIVFAKLLHHNTLEE